MMSSHNRPMLPAATRVHGARLVDALDEVGRGGSSNSRLPWVLRALVRAVGW